MYLDPHRVQSASLDGKDAITFHPETPRFIHIAKVDPSMALCFYITDEDDFNDFASHFLIKSKELSPWIAFGVMEESMTYSSLRCTGAVIEHEDCEMSGEDEWVDI